LSGTLLANDAFLGAIPAANLTSGKGGIGKSYSEADWVRAIRHGVKPDSRGEVFMYNYSTLSDQEVEGLVAEARRLLAENVIDASRAGAAEWGGYRRTTRRTDPDARLWVYGRGGAPCRVCGTAIEYRKQGPDARGTYWCPACQRAPTPGR
jgi:formamidopyrimidine-DNA glycosylase